MKTFLFSLMCIVFCLPAFSERLVCACNIGNSKPFGFKITGTPDDNGSKWEPVNQRCEAQQGQFECCRGEDSASDLFFLGKNCDPNSPDE